MAETDLQLVAELRALGRSAPGPDSDDVSRLVERVQARTATLPTPQPARVPTRRRRLVVVVVAVLVALLAVPPVRAAVLDWLGFGGVRVELGEIDGSAAPPPALRGGPAVQEAAAAVAFPVRVPDALGVPEGVAVSADARMVSMTWTVDGVVVRLDQFDGELDFLMAKRSPGVQFAAVAGSDALWFEEPHEVVLLDADGSRRTESARLAGNTLIWPQGTTTLRLEGDLPLHEAVRIAESSRPVG